MIWNGYGSRIEQEIIDLEFNLEQSRKDWKWKWDQGYSWEGSIDFA